MTETVAGRYLALPVAAHLARTQLVRDPLARCAPPAFRAMMDAVAHALVKVATVYTREGAAPRELTAAELDGAVVCDGGSWLLLKDGRKVSNLVVKRAELLQAIGLLRGVNIPELAPPRAGAPARDFAADLAALELLLGPPPQLDAATRLLVALARSAPRGPAAHTAMQLVTALHGQGGEAAPLFERLRSQLAR